ncbi:MAG: potassium/proton antiporter [Elusimicrobiota bacterium]|jgi:cell volume regulation protein A
MVSLEHWLLLGSVLLLASIFANTVADRFGVPALLLFLGIGMLAGANGPGGVPFHNAPLAQALGVIALVFILFAGALQTRSKEIRPVLWMGASLSTLGVLLTTVLVGWFAQQFLSFTWLEGLLFGAIVSSTDAAAVFTVLKSQKVSLKEPIRPLLEFESGSNDPMAVFLTIGLISLIQHPMKSPASLLLLFVTQMGLGGGIGYLAGRGMVLVLQRLKLEHEGLYSVLLLAMVLLTYSLASFLGGSGFLAVYLAGLVLAGKDYFHKKTMTRFQDGLAWLMQISMFLILGLLVLPVHLPRVFWPGLWLSFFLVFVARPASVFISLIGSGLSARKKAMVSWVGLRGAAPIILATFPLVARLPRAETYFNLVFFTVVVSVMLQGPSIARVARWLRVEVPFQRKRHSPLEFDAPGAIDACLEEFIVPFNSAVAGNSLTQLGLPADSLITLVCRDDRYLVPSGRTVLQEGDVISVLTTPDGIGEIQTLLSRQK